MKLRQLQDFFPPERHADIDSLFRRFQAEGGQDVEAFVMHLFARGLINDDTLRELLTRHEIFLTSPPDPDTPNPHLAKRHELITLLGKGAMGEVYLARDPELRRSVAVKRIDKKLVHRPAVAARFFAEAQITAQLDHPSIVPIYGVERDTDGCLAYAMKFVRGVTLKEYMDVTRAFFTRGEPPDEDHSLKARLELLLPVLNAIDYAHKRGVIHRDLKPDNIMIGDYGEVLVMDWGIARPIGRRERVSEGGAVEKTRAGALVGTPSYMSPEQASGATETLDATSDQYSLGLILFELVTLRRAITADSSFETVAKAASAIRAPIVHFTGKEKIPRELKAIIEKATARDPDDRYPSVDDLADDLRRYLRDEAVEASPDNAPQRLSRWIGQNRGLTLGLGVALILAVFVVAALLQWRSVVTLNAERQAARQRERALQELDNIVGDQAREMDDKLYTYENLLAGIANAAALSLTTDPPAEIPFYVSDGTGPPTPPPPDLIPSKVYEGPTSFDFLDLIASSVVKRSPAFDRELRQVARLGPLMRRAALLSSSPDAVTLSRADARALAFDRGVPLVWVYLGLHSGLAAGWPGVWNYEVTPGVPYDPRTQPWFKNTLAADLPGARWDSDGTDESGLGILMTAGQVIRDPTTSAPLGVAAVDLTFAYFIDAVLDAERLQGLAEPFILTAEGEVMARGSQKERARTATRFSHEPVSSPQMLGEDGRHIQEAIATRTSGHLNVSGGRLALWSRVKATGWYYVVVGEDAALVKLVRP